MKNVMAWNRLPRMMGPLLAFLQVISALPLAAIEIPKETGQIQGIWDEIKKSNHALAEIETIKTALDGISKEKNPAEHARLEKKISGLERDRIAARQAAIYLAIIAYGIAPVAIEDNRIAGPSGKLQMPVAGKGTPVHWFPTPLEDEARKKLYDREINPETGKKRSEKEIKKNDCGDTFFQGISVIFDQAFVSPGSLALTLYHEYQHFQQYTTAGRGEKMSWSARELEAWQEDEKISNSWLNKVQLNGFKAEELGFRDEEELRRNRALGITRSAEFEQAVMWEKGGWRRPEPDDSAQRVSPAALESLKNREQDLGAIVAKELEYARQRQEEMKVNRTLSYMRDIALFVCASPSRLPAEDLDNLPRVDPGPCMWLVPWPSGHSCAKDVFQWMCHQLRDKEPLTLDGMEAAMSNQCAARIAAQKDLLMSIVRKSCEAPGSVGAGPIDQLNDFHDPYTEFALLLVPVDDPYGSCKANLYNSAKSNLAQGIRLEPDWFAREAYEQIRRQSPIRIVRVKEPLGYALADIASKACADPSSISAAIADRLSAAGFPDKDPVGADSAARELTGCSRALFDELLGFSNSWEEGTRLSVSWLKDEASALAERYRPQPSGNPQTPEKRGKEKPDTGGPCHDGGSGCGQPHPTMPRH